MKVALFSPYLPKHTGGGEKYLFDCARVFKRNDFEVSIALSSEKELSLEEITSIKKKYEEFLNCSLDGINFIASPIYTKANFIKKLFWTAKFDVLYYQTDGSLFFSLARKNILHIQVPLRISKKSLIERIKLFNWRVKNTNSEFTKKYIEKYWQTKIDFVHQPYVDLQEFQGTDILAKENIILSVGRFFCQLHSKKQDVLVKFFKDLVELNKKSLSSWKMILVGKNEDQEFAKRVAELAKDLNIEILHDLNRKDLIKIYQKSAIYWHASGYEIDEEIEPEKVEHFGISTLEAMAAKTLPIVINKGGQKEILGDDLNLCLWNNEQECLAKTLELIENKSKREKLANLAFERSRLFSKEKFEQILLIMVRS